MRRHLEGQRNNILKEDVMENDNNKRTPWWVWLLIAAGLMSCCLMMGLIGGVIALRDEAPTIEPEPTATLASEPEPTATEAPAPTAVTPFAVSTPISPELNTSCGTWNTSAKATNWLVPGASARGDVEVNGVVYYDSGVGEGTTIINLSTVPLEVYAEWGSGCEVSVDLQFLVNKDLIDGCGGSCSVARVVVFEDGKDPVQTYYAEPIE